jgi:hypothetical protein
MRGLDYFVFSFSASFVKNEKVCPWIKKKGEKHHSDAKGRQGKRMEKRQKEQLIFTVHGNDLTY